MYSVWGYLQQRNCISGLHRFKVMNFLKILHFEICIFHEIRQISPWNLPDVMKSSRFHNEICRISWNLHTKWAKDPWSYFWSLKLIISYFMWWQTCCILYHKLFTCYWNNVNQCDRFNQYEINIWNISLEIDEFLQYFIRPERWAK